MSEKQNELQEMIDNDCVPAVPPQDYRGSMADWQVELMSRGLWNGEGFYGDVILSTDEWWDILESCEGPEDSQ